MHPFFVLEYICYRFVETVLTPVSFILDYNTLLSRFKMIIPQLDFILHPSLRKLEQVLQFSCRSISSRVLILLVKTILAAEV